jgi:hypothetical protein
MRVVEILSFNNTSNSPQFPNTFSFFNPKSQYINWSCEEGEKIEENPSITSSHKVRGEMEGAKVGGKVGICE